MPRVQGRWCPVCGAGVSWDDEVCPSCGLPLDQLWDGADAQAGFVPVPSSPSDELPSIIEAELSEEEEEEEEPPRIESAIPAEDDPHSKLAEQEAMPHTGRLLLAALASVALIGGLAVFITHPWDPDIYSIKATEEADTSMAGFPGTVDSLSGQDSDASADVEVLAGDDASFALLEEAYTKLGRYATRADKSEELYAEVAYTGDKDERTKGKREADALAIDISNVIDAISQVDVSSGLYADEQEHLLTLGNWLRNRVDTIRTAWTQAAASDDPKADTERLQQLIVADHNSDGLSAYKVLFDDNYEAWKPEKKSA